MSPCFELDLKVTNTGLESLSNDIPTCNMGKIKSGIVVNCRKLGWHISVSFFFLNKCFMKQILS